MRMRSPLQRALAVGLSAAAVALVACGGDDADSNPETLLGEAAAKPIPNAEIDLRSQSDVPGFPVLGTKLTVTAAGPWVAKGPGGAPAFDWVAALRADGQRFPARISGVNGSLYIDFMGNYYEAGDEVADRIGFSDVRAGDDGASLAQLGLDPDRWLTKVKVSDGGEVGGDDTKLVTGTVAKRAVVEDLLGLVDRERLQDVEGVPEIGDDQIDAAVDAIDAARVEVNVDGDGYPRRVYAKLRFTVPEDVEDTAIEGGTVTFAMELDAIGETTVDVEPPFQPEPLSSLLDFAGNAFSIDELSDLWTQPR